MSVPPGDKGPAADRPGDVRLDLDPAAAARDAGLVFIGRIRSPWPDRAACPKNLREARERGRGAEVELGPDWRPGLRGLSPGQHVLLLYWMHDARRDLIIQTPRHRAEPVGTFALRSPARPNPIALAVVKVLDLDPGEGRIRIDAIDCIDGTPLLDIKPWLPGVDIPPDWPVPG